MTRPVEPSAKRGFDDWIDDPEYLLDLVAKHWTLAQLNPDEAGPLMGSAVISFPGYRNVRGMMIAESSAFSRTDEVPYVFIGHTVSGHMLAVGYLPDPGHPRRTGIYTMRGSPRQPCNVFDGPTAWLLLSLLSPRALSSLRPTPPAYRPRPGEPAAAVLGWEVFGEPLPLALAGPLPLGVAALTLAAVHGGFGRYRGTCDE